MAMSLGNEDEPSAVDARQILRELVEEAGVALFEHYGVDLAANTGNGKDLERVAVIGFSSDVIRGALGLAISTPVLEASFEGVGNINDWVGELANQMLGRLKNLLLRYDVTLYLATPMVLRGLKLELATSGRQELIAINFQSDQGDLCVWLDVQTEPGLELTPSAEEEDLGMEEGALLFF
ncbi:MAG: chemotaxis protein CheX [Myxococcota bacterium]